MTEGVPTLTSKMDPARVAAIERRYKNFREEALTGVGAARESLRAGESTGVMAGHLALQLRTALNHTTLSVLCAALVVEMAALVNDVEELLGMTDGKP